MLVVLDEIHIDPKVIVGFIHQVLSTLSHASLRIEVVVPNDFDRWDFHSMN
jgi:hypothetical protein